MGLTKKKALEILKNGFESRKKWGLSATKRTKRKKKRSKHNSVK